MIEDFEDRKRRSVLQVLFKAARLANEEAIRRVREATGNDRVRVAHTMLFPHVSFEGVRLTELADRLGVTKQAVQQLVDELEQMGVFERVPDPSDGRAKLIRWKPEGLLHGLDVLGELESELANVTSEKQFAALHESLLLIVAHLE